MFRLFQALPLLFLFIFTFCSCGRERQVHFNVSGTNALLYAESRAAQEGQFDFSSPKKLEYRFDSSFFVPSNSSLQIEYEITYPPHYALDENYSLGLSIGSTSWQLPVYKDIVSCYAIPVEDSFNGYFAISLDPYIKTDKTSSPVFKIRSIGFSPKFFGFYSGSDSIVSTPFIYRQDSGYVIDVPSSAVLYPMYTNIEAFFSPAGAELELKNLKIITYPGIDSLYVPQTFCPVYGQLILTGEEIMSFTLKPDEASSFPQPVKADPAIIIEFPIENWRNPRYEIFHWDRFPSLLIFDYADYEEQDKMLKRLAFFVEKAGFRGRLARDEEIAGLHGWNAHDYNCDDLAWFFDTARKINFPLLDEERELERILLSEGIIKEANEGIAAGEGAIISISRESSNDLRYRFMAHEGFHGLYFIDEDFRNFSRRRWEQLHITAKRFITSFFNYQQYDTKDEYLLLNEFMAHVLQQPASRASNYFGRQLPSVLEKTWRAGDLPEKDELSGSWPFLGAVFTDEAQVFSDYVNQRWGLAAGRVWSLNIRN